MAKKKKPVVELSEDEKLLAYAGWLGHEYVGIIGEPGKRRTLCEVNDLPAAQRIGGDDKTLKVYCRYDRRSKNKWLCVHDRPMAEPAQKLFGHPTKKSPHSSRRFSGRTCRPPSKRVANHLSGSSMFKAAAAHKAFVRGQLAKYGKGRDNLPYTGDFDSMFGEFCRYFDFPYIEHFTRNEYWRLIAAVCKQGKGKTDG